MPGRCVAPREALPDVSWNMAHNADSAPRSTVVFAARWRTPAQQGRYRRRPQVIAVARDIYREKQGALGEALARCKPDCIDGDPKKPRGCHWLITDFVTAGSPLAHGSLVLAQGMVELRDMQSRRLLATCPAALDSDEVLAKREAGNRKALRDRTDESDNGYTFEDENGRTRPIHSAVFPRCDDQPALQDGKVRGCRRRRRRQGQRQFGAGIEDVELSREDTGAAFAHNEYWKSKLSTKELRKFVRERAARRISGR